MATSKESEIKILNSQDSGSTPDVSQMAYGELAINSADDNLYYKNGSSSIGTISGRTPHMGFEYIYKTSGVTKGTTGCISFSGNTLSIHPEDNDGNDTTAFLNLVRLSSAGLVYIGDESLSKDLNVSSFLTAVTAGDPNGSVYELGGGERLVSNTPSNNQKVRMLVTVPAMETPPVSAPTELIYEYLHGYTFDYEGDTNINMLNSEGNASALDLDYNGMMLFSKGYGVYKTQLALYPEMDKLYFNNIDRHGTDSQSFFDNLADGDTIRLENVDPIFDSRFTGAGGANLRQPGELFYEFEVRADGNGSIYSSHFDDVESWQNGDTGDFRTLNISDDATTQIVSDLFGNGQFDSSEIPAAQNFVDALALPQINGGEDGADPPGTYTEPPTGVKGVRFRLTVKDKGLIAPNPGGLSREFLRGSGEEIFRYTATGGAPGSTGNGQLFLDFPSLGTDTITFHKFNPKGSDNRSFFSDLTNSNSTITINRKAPIGVLGSAFAILEVGPSSYDGTNYSFNINNAITGGTNGYSGSTAGQPSITAGDELVVKFAVKGSFNNVETLNGLTGGVTLNAGSNMTVTSGASGITLSAAVLTGATGATGAVGATGATGAAGATGATGAAGAAGAAGATGATGAAGAAGATGATGTFDSSGAIHCAGISSDGGITFPDGTHQTTVTRTDSYTGHIETVSDKTYTLDPKVATARTITGFYIKSASGTVTATLKNGSDTIKAASVSNSSGDQTSLANISVAADAVLTMVTSSNSSALDVIFNVEYTSTL